MTHTITPIDDVAGWVDVIRIAKAQIAEKEAVIAQARERIEAALGDYEVGTVAGVPVVRWTYVHAEKFDQRKAKALLGDRVAECIVATDSRRFSLVDPDES